MAVGLRASRPVIAKDKRHSRLVKYPRLCFSKFRLSEISASRLGDSVIQFNNNKEIGGSMLTTVVWIALWFLLSIWSFSTAYFLWKVYRNYSLPYERKTSPLR